MTDLAKRLEHVLWLGGGTDAGKTTVAHRLAEKHGLHAYLYDRFDVRDHKRLAATDPSHYGAIFTASVEENWLLPTPEARAARSKLSFRDRLPFVLDDLLELPTSRPILAEGFGLTPELIAPLLSRPDQALFLVPTPAFKRASMLRRGKPVRAKETSDPKRYFHNLYTRDMLLSAEIRQQAQRYGFRVLETGEQSVHELVAQVETGFGLR